MEQTRLQFLLERYAENKTTEQEKQELWDYIQAHSDSRLFEEAGLLLLEKETGTVDLPPAYAAIFNQIVQIDRTGEAAAVQKEPAPVRLLFRFRKRSWVAAAAILAVLVTGSWWWIANNKNTASVPVAKKTAPITPGREGAILTLANGSQVLLDTIDNGAIARQGGAVAKVVEGALVYEASGSEVVYNTMSTPKGRQYQLKLPDGSTVWLNAVSSIRYPTVFAGKERRVAITGEAYFEVAKDKNRPFFVEVDGGETVKVLGTSFNINAYRDEQKVTTTLIEGVVNIIPASQAGADITPVKLQPGQQAVASLQAGTTTAGETIQVLHNVDTQKVLAWKNGLFNFEGTDLKTTMRQLARWYDFDVEYRNNVSAIRFKGKMYRNVDFKDILEMLRRMEVNFRMDNRTMVVY